MDNYKRFKTPKTIVFNEKGVRVRRCPKCRSTRLKRTIENGFECLKCGFINKRRLTNNPEEIGRVSFVQYGK